MNVSKQLDVAAIFNFKSKVGSSWFLGFSSTSHLYVLAFWTNPNILDEPNAIGYLKARLHSRFLSQQLDAIFVALKL